MPLRRGEGQAVGGRPTDFYLRVAWERFRQGATADLQDELLFAGEADDEAQDVAQVNETVDRAGKAVVGRRVAEEQSLRPDAERGAVADAQGLRGSGDDAPAVRHLDNRKIAAG